MAKLYIVFILVCLLVIMARGSIETRFRVYVHETISGPNATLYEVARANITSASPTSFGLVRVADDLITSGPAMNTGELGRAQGLVVDSGLTETVTMITADFVFTAGKYGGSTIFVRGRKLQSIPNQELAVVGGTAAFRLARGYAISNTYSYDAITNAIVFTYDFYLYLI